MNLSNVYFIESIDRHGTALVWNRRRNWWYERDSFDWSYSLVTNCGYKTKRGASVAKAKIWPVNFNKRVSSYSDRMQWEQKQ